MTASGNAQAVQSAKDAFGAALIGLIIIFIAFILLYVINPDLVKFSGLSLPNVTTPTPTSRGTSGTTGTVSPVNIQPPGGAFNTPATVVMTTSTSGATIRYTLDGSNPTSSSIVYSGQITLNQTTTVKAQAFKSGMTNSTVATYVFTIITP